MKKFIKTIAIVLSALIMFTCTYGCNEKDAYDGPAFTYTENEYYTGGTHTGYDNIKNVAGEYIVENGVVNYQVIVRDATDKDKARVNLIKSDFQKLFMEATNRDITILNESQVSAWNETDKYIVIGAETIEAKAGLDREASLEVLNAQGFQIKTVGKSIFVIAEDSIGSIFGMYELFTQLFNYDIFTVEQYYIDKNVSTVPLKNFNITDNPDIERRIGPFGDVYTDATNANRMRFVLQHRDVFAKADGIHIFHNTLDFLPPADYIQEHPEWYAQKIGDIEPKPNTNVHQLCYTAGKFDPVKNLEAIEKGSFEGYNDSFEAMLQEMTKRVIFVLETDREHNILTITAEDNKKYCGCEGCEDAKNYYGALSGAMWSFINEISRRVGKYLETEQPGRDVLISMYAYHSYVKAPVKEDEQGNVVPVDASVVGEPNAAIYMTSSGAYNSFSFNHEVNKEMKQRLAEWQVCCDHFGAWLYQTTYDDYFMPYDNFGSMQDNYRALLDLGVRWMFNQGQQGNTNPTHFSRLKIYLNSKFEWNVNANYGELVQKYFDNVYGPASEKMYEYFTNMRAHMGTLQDVDMEASIADPANFPYETVYRWKTYCDEAIEIIKAQVSDPVMQEVYCDNIITESLMPRYMIQKWYEGSIGSGSIELAEFRSAFKKDVRRVGLSEWSQHESIEQIIGEW